MLLIRGLAFTEEEEFKAFETSRYEFCNHHIHQACP